MSDKEKRIQELELEIERLWDEYDNLYNKIAEKQQLLETLETGEPNQ